MNGDWGISYKIALRWMPLDLTDDKSTLVQVMAWCRQATSHYLSQCWPRSMSPNGVGRPQWVNLHSKQQYDIPVIFTLELVEPVHMLTRWGWVMQKCISKIGHHWFRQWLVTCLAPKYYLNECWHIVNWTQILLKFESKYNNFLSRKCIWTCCLQNVTHFISGSIC